MDEDDDWAEAALNTRHLHNRNDRGGRGNTREAFQIRQTFGTHLVKCPALERLGQQASSSNPGAGGGKQQPGKKQQVAAGKKKAGGRSNSGSAGEVVLDIYRLTDDEDGVLGSLKLAGVFEAAVVFAGSRKILGSITRGLGQDDEAAEEPAHGKRRGGSSASSSPQAKKASGPHNEASANGSRKGDDEEEDEDEGEDESDDDEEDDDDEEFSDGEHGQESHEHRQRRRAATFEKNSFRQPKFWFRWQGVLSDDAVADLEDELEAGQGGGNKVHGSGYVVFSGNDCRRFQGTMTSARLGWNNVKMTGWKAKPQPERDFEIQWTTEA